MPIYRYELTSSLLPLIHIGFSINALLSDLPNENAMVSQLKALASKVLFALSLNNFNAVFSRISSRQVITYLLFQTFDYYCKH